MRLWLRRLEIEGFGPYPERTVLEFPDEPGVTVVYGNNMRGKTSLMNAVFYAFFGVVRDRHLRPRPLAKATNRDNAKDGRYGFTVSLAFSYEGDEYELVRTARPVVARPVNDEDFTSRPYLKRNGDPLGPDEQEHLLRTILPADVARFFLFDGELLSQYEELLIDESQTGRQISEAIEKILGVPVLKAGRAHLDGLADAAAKAENRESTRHDKTANLGTLIEELTKAKEDQERERGRLEGILVTLGAERAEVDGFLRANERAKAAVAARDLAEEQRDRAEDAETQARADLRANMAQAWRTVLGPQVQAARDEANAGVADAFSDLLLAWRLEAVEQCHCGTCDQDVPEDVRARLAATVPADAKVRDIGHVTGAGAVVTAGALNRFRDADVRPAVDAVLASINRAVIDRAAAVDAIRDLTAEIANADPEVLRERTARFERLNEEIAAVRRGIADADREIDKIAANIEDKRRKRDALGEPALAAFARRTKVLKDAAAVFVRAVEVYKQRLRTRVQDSASALFLQMTTEKQDYARLQINDQYGLSIIHADGEEEDGRSAGAEQVVALALMGALHANAPLDGPIVMDTPFSRLDPEHTANVVMTLPAMADQVVLFVQEGEISRGEVRRLLASDGRLLREYELVRRTARRTDIVRVV
ncbi:MAG TPA: AAA family ATPase [Polyangia bacterium]|jgi:DNA sulfur modification protein DndD